MVVEVRWCLVQTAVGSKQKDGFKTDTREKRTKKVGVYRRTDQTTIPVTKTIYEIHEVFLKGSTVVLDR